MSILTLPGLIDPHVHLRDPGQTHKEDFYTGTCAALAGGYTTIIDMPNNKFPITTLERLNEKTKIAKEKIVCDVGFYFGSVGDNLSEFPKVLDKVLGLKLYLNETTGNLLVDEKLLEKIFLMWGNKSTPLTRHSGNQAKPEHPESLYKLHANSDAERFWTSSPRWSSRLARLAAKQRVGEAGQNDAVSKPILVHAEERMVEKVINVVKKTNPSTPLKVKLHFCHISTMSDLKQIIKAKEQGIPVTCGVTPHHLFLTDRDEKELGPFGLMKPSLATQKDQDFLWKKLKYIDVIESDHAPHTVEEKQCHSEPRFNRGRGISHIPMIVEKDPSTPQLSWVSRDDKQTFQTISTNTPYGVPGLETTLPLLLTAVSQNRLTTEDIIRLCFENPSRIFFDRKNCDANVEVDLHKSYIINHKSFFTKCEWSPFDGWKVKGKVRRVFIRGKKVFEDGKVLAKPGFGRII